MEKKLDSAIKTVTRQFMLREDDLGGIIDNFHADMEKGLTGAGGSLKMIPTYIDRSSGNETGDYIALDLGGSNFRILNLSLDGKRRIRRMTFRKFKLQQKHITGEGKELFAFLAKCIKEFAEAKKLEGKLFIGFTFSFPVNQMSIDSGELVRWTKGFSSTGVEGRDVVELLEKALARQGINEFKVAALANDTVGTLVAKSYTQEDCDVGAIFGTGTNACYREKLSNIKKWTQPFSSDNMIVNIEWGNFDGIPRTKYDEKLDRFSENPKEQKLEKMVSGMYLGEIVRLVLSDLMDRGLIFHDETINYFNIPYTFKSEFMSLVEADKTKDLSAIARFLAKHDIKKSTESDRRALKFICEIVIQRAARICAAVLAAVLTKMDADLSGKHTVAIDGSVYEKYPGFKSCLHDSLKELFGRKIGNLSLELAKDGSGKGAAIVAAVARSQRTRK